MTCLGAPDTLDDFDKKTFGMFFTTMPFILPCGSCGQHFYEVLQVDPVENALTSQKSLFEWSVRVHNTVNRRLQKPEVSLDDALRHWSKIALGEQSPSPMSVKRVEEAPKREPQQLLEMVVMLIIGFSLGGGLGFMYSNRVAAPR